MRLVRQRAGIVEALRVAAMMEEEVEAIARVPSREATSRDMEDDNMAQLESVRIWMALTTVRCRDVAMSQWISSASACVREQASE